MAKRNPYNVEYVMERDACSYEQALTSIDNLKARNASTKGKKFPNRKSPYKVTDVMAKNQCTEEEAIAQIEQYKANKATNLKNFIAKYGEDEGTSKFNEWKNKSLAIGHAVAKENGSSQSKFSPAYYIRHGHTLDEAQAMARAYQHRNSPLHIEYYLVKGHSIEFAKNKIRRIHDKKLGKDAYREFLAKQFNYSESKLDQLIAQSRGHFTRAKLGDTEFEARAAKIRSTLERNGVWIPLQNKDDYALYHKEVWHHTRNNDLSVLPGYNLRGRAGNEGAYHLDHKFSISRGYLEGISPKIIGSIANLHFITWEENVTKQGKCWITAEELINEN